MNGRPDTVLVSDRGAPVDVAREKSEGQQFALRAVSGRTRYLIRRPHTSSRTQANVPNAHKTCITKEREILSLACNRESKSDKKLIAGVGASSVKRYAKVWKRRERRSGPPPQNSTPESGKKGSPHHPARSSGYPTAVQMRALARPAPRHPASRYQRYGGCPAAPAEKERTDL